MRKVLDVLHVYSGNLFGGVERMLISLAAHHDQEIRSHFALCFEGRLSQALQATGERVSLLGPVRLRNPLSARRARQRLQRVLRATRFDRVVCHSIWSYGIFASIAARNGYAPILFLHDIPNPNTVLYRWGWLRPPALCIVNSLTTAEPLRPLRDSVPIRVVHPLVNPPPAQDHEAIARLRTELGAAPEEVVVLLASRLDEGKGHRNLLAALAAIREIPGWRCWIAGAPQRPEEAAYKEELLRLSGALDLSGRVQFIGHRDDMEAVLAACDVCCQPNETPEAFGLVFVEAMFAGKPVVGRAIGGAREIVTPECGILCPPGSGPLADALRTLINDRGLREQMSQAAPKRALSLSGPQQFFSALLGALDSVPNQS